MPEARRLNTQELPPAAEGQAPEWVFILPAGMPATIDGLVYLVDERAVNSILAAFQRRGQDMVIDYEHQTKSGDIAPAAGWIKELQSRTDGIWGRVQWTPRGRAFVVNREYRYLSPVVLVENASQRVMEIQSVALTNLPRIANFPALTNKSPVHAGAGYAGLDPIQREINRALGISDEAFSRHACLQAAETMNRRPAEGADLQAKINACLGIREDVFGRYFPQHP
jgi:phage I-like protein